MKRLPNALLSSLLALFLVVAGGCGGENDAVDYASGPKDTDSTEAGEVGGGPPAGFAVDHPVYATETDGVQTVEITVTSEGYAPAVIQLKPGVPARLVFTRTVDSECARQVQIPDFGVEKTELPLNEPYAIEFTPTEGGPYQFICGMNMMKGTILVAS